MLYFINLILAGHKWTGEWYPLSQAGVPAVNMRHEGVLSTVAMLPLHRSWTA